MSKKLFIFLSVALIAASAYLSYFWQNTTNYREIIENYTTNYSDGILYGIDLTDDNFCIYKANTETGEQDFFYVDRMQNDEQVLVKSVTMNKSGDIYAMLSVGEQDLIKLCDFEKDELVDVFDAKSSDLYPVTQYQDQNNNMVCVYYDDTNFYHYEIVDGEFSLIKTTSHQTTNEDLLYFVLFVNNQTWTTSFDGSYGFLNEDGTESDIFINDGSILSTNLGNEVTFVDGLAIQDLDSDKYYKIEYSDGQPNIYQIDTFDSEIYDDIYMFESVYQEDINSILTSKYTEEGRLIPILVGDTNIEIEYLQKDFNYKNFAIMSIASAVLAIIILFASYKMINSKRGVSINLIIFVVAILAAIVGLFLLEDFLKEKLIELDDQRLLESSIVLNQVIIDTIDIEAFEKVYEMDSIIHEDIYTYHTERYQNNFSYYNEMTKQENGISSTYGTNMYFFKNDAIYAAQDNILNKDLKYVVLGNLYDALLECKETEENVLVYYTEYGIELITTISPIYSSQGEVIGAVEVTQDYIDQYEEMDSLINTILSTVIRCIVIILLVICAIIGISIKDIWKVTNHAYKISQGDFREISPIKGRSEIAKLNKTLIKTTANIENQSKEIHTLHDKYNAFVPDTLLNINFENDELEVGVSRDVTGHSVFIGSWNNEHDEFSFFNQILGDSIEYLIEKGAYIDRMVNHEIKAFSLDLNGTVDLCGELIKKSRSDIFISITLEQLRVGVIGNDNRRAIKAISKFDKFSTEINNIAQEYCIPLIISGEAVLKITNFHHKYQTRKVAYIYVESLDKVETIYEVIFVNKQDIARKKLDSKYIFEQGLEYFVAGNIEGAMRRFTTVYRENPQDLMAKEYIFRCEQRNKNPETKYYFLEL